MPRLTIQDAFALASRHHQAGRLREAEQIYRQILAQSPSVPEVHNRLGVVLHQEGRLDQAMIAYRQAIALRPTYPEAHNHLAIALLEKGQVDQAIVACRKAIELNPNYAEAHSNLGNALKDKGESDQAIAAHRQAIALNPNLPQAYSNLGVVLHDYQIVAAGQPLPAFDVHLPLLSLPRLIGTTLQNIPIAIPYLQADPQDAKTWQSRLAGRSQKMNVGLVWGGSPAQRNDRNRSMSLANLAPLGEVFEVCFFSLQKGEPAAQAKTPPTGLALVDWSDDLKDFADTAALIANLDLVITVDTAVAHLAGAMGKPVWVMVPFIPPWQWLLDRSDSPWYPTARLFRQSAGGDWSGVVLRVAEALSLFREKKSGE